MTNNTVFTIYPKAEDYIRNLVKDRDVKQLCLFVDNPNTPQAETCLCYFDDVENKKDFNYKEYTFNGFEVFIKEEELVYLQDAEINIIDEEFGEQLTINAPNSKNKPLAKNANLKQRIDYLLKWEINPFLSSHGGFVTLSSLENNDTVILEFGGGCQGCSMIDQTLKHTIEKQIKDAIPEIKIVKDVTDHTNKEKSYY